MRLVWGALGFPIDGVQLATYENTLHVRYVPYAKEVSARISGEVFGTTRELALLSALITNGLRTPYQDLILYDDAGVPVYNMLSAGSLTGVLCMEGPQFDEAQKPATWGTFREFRATFSAQYPYNPQGSVIMEAMQTTSMRGGCPVMASLPVIGGDFTDQQMTRSSPVTAEQTGYAIGLFTWPSPPAMLINNMPLVDKYLRYGSPERYGLGVRGFKTEWGWFFRKSDLSGPLPLPTPGLPPV